MKSGLDSQHHLDVGNDIDSVVRFASISRDTLDASPRSSAQQEKVVSMTL